ncbi:hypothetical protein [Cecembia sp.]|uniref:hypothetical protein n=1 Tax=Cecembia sp. TaxID=1898110 RepID=UPI0025B95514|nr:hypothetical protein [Cecembia sp.]
MDRPTHPSERPIYKKRPKDSFWKGLAAGFLFPFVGYAVLLLIYDQLDNLGVISDLGMSPDFRERTLALISICLIIIPANYFRKQYMNDAIRGLVLPMVVFVILWLYYYGPGLF